MTTLEYLSNIPFLGPIAGAVITAMVTVTLWLTKRHFAYGERIAKLEEKVVEQDTKIKDMDKEMEDRVIALHTADERIETKIDRMAGKLDTHIEDEDKQRDITTKLILDKINSLHEDLRQHRQTEKGEKR